MWGYDEDGERIPLLKAARFPDGREYWYEDPFNVNYEIEDGEPIWYTRGKVEGGSTSTAGRYRWPSNYIEKTHSFTVEKPSIYFSNSSRLSSLSQKIGEKLVGVDNNRSWGWYLHPGNYQISLSDLALDPALVSGYGNYEYPMQSPRYRAGGSTTVSYSLSHIEKTEEEVFMHFFVELLNGPHPENIIMDYATQDDTAKAGEDYVATRGTLFFPAGTPISSDPSPFPY